MNPLPGQLIFQAALIFANAFFASAEIAVISLNPSKLRADAESGNRQAGKLLKLTEAPAEFLSSIQVGITLAGFLGSAFAAESFSEYLVKWIYDDIGFRALSVSVLDTVSVIVITLILSYFTLVFGELVPKRIAMQKPYETARLSCGIISAISVLLKPVITFLSFSTNCILKLLHFKTEAEKDNVTKDEIRMMMDLGEENGAIESNEKKWIDNVFDFKETLVKEIMTRKSDVVYIYEDNEQKKIVDTIQSSGYSRIPILKKGSEDIVGILNAKKYLLSVNLKKGGNLSELIQPAYFIPENIRASSLFCTMQKNKLHFAVAVNEYGETSGIITTEDLVEEIVGNIYDEFDMYEIPNIIKTSGNQWSVAGNTNISEIESELDTEIPHEKTYETLTGLIFSLLNSVLKDASSFDLEISDLKIHVTSVKNRKIKYAEIEKISGEEKNTVIYETA